MGTTRRRLAWSLGQVILLAAMVLAVAPQAAHCASAAPAGASMPRLADDGPNQLIAVPYRSWNHKARHAVVVLPRDYVGGQGEEALPCIVQPHGR